MAFEMCKEVTMVTQDICKYSIILRYFVNVFNGISIAWCISVPNASIHIYMNNMQNKYFGVVFKCIVCITLRAIFGWDLRFQSYSHFRTAQTISYKRNWTLLFAVSRNQYTHILRFGLGGSVRQNPYPFLGVILAENGTRF